MPQTSSLRRTLLYVAAAILAVMIFGPASAVAQDNSAPPKVGEGCLMYRSPVSGVYETVPLTHTDVQLDVRGLVLAGTVTQQYSNSSSSPIEAVYIFPLPHDGAVYDMEIRVGNRVIRSAIKEREEAKKTYEAAKAQGKRAALVEEERPNIFTTSVANIMPGDKIDVRLRYVEPLRWEDGRMRIVFPMVVGPRYIPGTQGIGHEGTGWAVDTNAVPDASRITPVVRNPDSRSGHDISVSVDLDSGFGQAIVKSPSHEIRVEQASDGRQHVELATMATIPNKDFVLEVQQPSSLVPTTALFLSPGKSGETNFVLTAYPPTVQPKARMPLEMLYMIDTSGSMEGTSIQQAREALLNALDRLAPTDRFAILSFNSNYREFSPEPVMATTQNLAAARQYVKSLQAGGGTEMLPALEHLMHTQQASGYLRHIVLLTDGDLGNEEQIFAAMRSDLGNARLFTVAIGSAPNMFLATKMAQFGRGTFTQISDNSETKDKMMQLFDQIESPVLTDVSLSFAGVEVADVYPKRAPDMFLRQPLVVYGRITKGQKGTVHLTARNGNQPFETTIAINASKASFHPGITTLWATQKVEDMMDDWRHATDENRQKEIRSAIIAHAIQYRLVTRFTSLVAVEEVVVNPGGNSNTVPAPTELPAGWSMDAVFGPPATGTTDDFLQALGIGLLIAGAALWYAARRRRGAIA
jgi:Ca-activated chloride channel family protein